MSAYEKKRLCLRDHHGGGVSVWCRASCLLTVALFFLVPLAKGYAENWPSFRGPQGTGVSSETGPENR